MLKKIIVLIPSLIFLSTNYSIGQDAINYPVNIIYIEGSVYETNDNTFSLLGGSKWLKLSYAYLLPTSDIFIILTSEDGSGRAFSDGSEIDIKYLSGSLDYKRGKLNLVTQSLGDGAILKMADDSLWEIDSYDQYDTGYWLPPYQVIITSNELYLINFKEGKKYGQLELINYTKKIAMCYTKFKTNTVINLIFGLILFSMVSCMPAEYVASSNQNNGIEKVYRQGLELLVSEKEHSNVIAGIKRYEEGKEHMQLLLFIQNKSNESFNVLPTSINVLHEKEGKSEKLEVYPPDEAVAKITFDERLAAALNAAAASYNQNTNIDTDVNEDLAQSSALAAAVKGKNVRETLLRNETLFEGEIIFGVVYFAIKDSGKLKITIPTGDESHTFYFISID